MSKQDRQGARTVSDLEQRYLFERRFSEILGVANDAQRLASEAKKSYDGLSHEQIFNLLTNSGTWQGMYEEGGNVYINASYIKSGEFDAALIKAGILQSVDGETFKLNLNEGTLCLKSGGNVIMDVGPDGAKLSGWDISQDYLGTANAGLNGNIAFYNKSLKDGTSTLLRFYAGANNGRQREGATLAGIDADSEGKFRVNVILPHITATPLNADIRSISVTVGDVRVPLAESDFNSLLVHGAGNILTVSGEIKNSAYYGCAITIQTEYDSCVPAFQVLDDGSLIVEHAKIGGYSIADLVNRIEALERKVGS